MQETAPVATHAAQVDSIEELPAPDVWKDAVARTAADVRAGRYAKVVLARQQRVHLAATPISPPPCATCASTIPVPTSSRSAPPVRCLLGGTPERLIRLNGSRGCHALYLAGTTARGAAPEEDARLADRLVPAGARTARSTPSSSAPSATRSNRSATSG
ncbi:MAG: chorismate-binding protein [Chloroflexia bacterium]